MLIILTIGLVFYIVGAIKGLNELCEHYGTKAKLDTLLTTKQCEKKITPLNCLKPVPDVNSCHGYKNLSFNKSEN